jgi:hypothetical protein
VLKLMLQKRSVCGLNFAILGGNRSEMLWRQISGSVNGGEFGVYLSNYSFPKSECLSKVSAHFVYM